MMPLEVTGAVKGPIPRR